MKNRKTLLIVLGISILLIASGIGIYFYIKNKAPDNTEVVNKTSVLETIKDYDYTLEDRDHEIYKQTFNELKALLSKEEIDFTKYAELLSKLYIIDFYTLDNKVNKYDIGALEFIHPDAKDNFALKAGDTIYKYIIDNSYKNRKQDLPNVLTVETSNIKEEQVKINEELKDGFTVDLTWTYEKELGYDKKATLKLLKSDKKLYIIKQSVSE